MSQPPPYVPATSFISYQASQSWFPGQQLDAEFNNLATIIGDIEADLALIQADDGALAQGIVDIPQLSAGVLAILGNPTELAEVSAAVNAMAASQTAAATSALNSASSATASAASASAAAATEAALVAGISATSTTSATIGTGSLSITIQTGKLYVAGMFLLVSGVSPANYMHGTVTSYNATSGALVMNIVDVGGSGTFASWTVTLSGTQGPTGATGGITSLNTLTGTLTLNANGSTVVTSSGSTITLGDPGGFLNVVRNGHMDVAQRGASGSVTSASTAYTLDGWQVAPTGATAAWAQEYNANISGNALRISCATGMTACNLQQRIESSIASHLLAANKSAQAITVQFTVYNNSGASITPRLATGYASAQDNFATVTADLAPTSLQSIANATLATLAYTFTPSVNLVNGYQLQLQFGGGLNAASGYVDVSLVDCRVTPGLSTGLVSNPTPPEMRPISSELSFCQRYFYQGIPGLVGTASSTTATARMTGNHPVTMRASPTVTMTSNVTVFAGASSTITGFSGTSESSATVLQGDGSGATGLTSGAAAVTLIGSGGTGNITVSAEL